MIASLLALDSDLTPQGKTELERYNAITSGGEPPLRSICVATRGYWFFADTIWHHVKADAEHSEVVSFIVGLFDVLARVAESRGRPRLAGYVVRS